MNNQPLPESTESRKRNDGVELPEPTESILRSDEDAMFCSICNEERENLDSNDVCMECGGVDETEDRRQVVNPQKEN